MYCPNCGKQLIDGSNFCPNCGTKISQSEQSTKIIKDESKSTIALDFLLCIIIPIILFILNTIVGKSFKGLNNLFTNFVLKALINNCTKISLIIGLFIASKKNQKKKNTISVISIIFSLIYIFYFIITTSINIIPFLKNGSSEPLTVFSQIFNISGIIFLILGIILICISIFQTKKIYNKCTIAFFSIAIISSIMYSTIHLVEMKPLLDKFSSLTSGISKSYTDTSKGQFGTWTVYLSYDNPDSKYSKYDNRYSRRSRNCYKDYAIQNAKDYLLIEHPRARNIYVDDCIYEGYSSSPID